MSDCLCNRIQLYYFQTEKVYNIYRAAEIVVWSFNSAYQCACRNATSTVIKFPLYSFVMTSFIGGR